MKITGQSRVFWLNIDAWSSSGVMQGHTSARWWESAIQCSHQVDAGGSVIMKESADVRVISGEIEAWKRTAKSP